MRLKMILVVALLVVVALTFTANAVAQQDPCGSVAFTLTPDSGVAGAAVAVYGTGALNMGGYTLYWDSVGGTALATASADGSGGFGTNINIPADAAVGSHTVIFDGTQSNEDPAACPQPFTVIAATAPAAVQPDAYTTLSALPSTGITVIAPIAGLLLSGAAFAAWRRRS
jgi:LPXTG-motif cell wall-anchored protein